MNASDPKKQDQGKISGMEDSTATTIEFLRKRLLAERDVSKSARQRADELSQKVAELEEQLRIVSLQRMKAEKATADVLAILECNGISDISETCDSSSDEETPCESKVGKKSSRGEDNSVSSKVRKNESGEVSSSDFEFSPVPSRCLSWKGCKNGSLDKYKDLSLRRRNTVVSAGHSPKHRQGKSCRQIRRREPKSSTEEFQASTFNHNSPENGVAIMSDVSTNFSDGGAANSEGTTEARQVKTLLESDFMENGQIVSSCELHDSVYGRDREMEKALEHQAELIGQYEEMEKAQREWEEKFRENNSATLDSCDPGNCSDITEERYEIRGQDPQSVGTITSQTNGEKSEVEDLPEVQSNGVVSTSNVDGQFSPEQRSTNTLISDTPTQDAAYCVANGDKMQESLENQNHTSLYNPRHHPFSHGSDNSFMSQSEPSLWSNIGGCSSNQNASKSQNELFAFVPRNRPGELGAVLEALKQARQSLQQKINQVPLLEGGPIIKYPEPSGISGISEDKLDFPVGCAGLFRLPIDFSAEGSTRANTFSSSTRLSLGNYYPDPGVLPGSSNQLVANSYLRSRSSFSTEDQFLGSRNVESESRIPMQRTYFDPCKNASLPSSSIDSRNIYQTSSSIDSRNIYQTYPSIDSRQIYQTSPSIESRQIYQTFSSNPAYQEMTSRMTNGEGPSTFLPRTAGVPPADHFAFSSEHIRPNMYRY